MLHTDRLRTVREQRGMSQSDLARVSGVAQHLISRYEAGLTDPGSATLGKLAYALDVSVDYLLGLSDSPLGRDSEDLSPESRRLLAAFEMGDHATVLELVTAKMRASREEKIHE